MSATYEQGPARRELARRAAILRAELVAQEHPGIAGQIRANAEAISHLETEMAAVRQMMADTVAAAGLAPEQPARPQLRLINGEAS